MKRALALALALVACDHGDGAVTTVYDPWTGEAYPEKRPRITLPASFALVPSSTTDVLSVVDLDAGVVVAEAPIGRKPVVVDGPQHVVADMARRLAFVVDAYPDATAAGTHAHGGSARPGFVQAVSLDDLRVVGEVRVDPNPGEIALSRDGKRLVVSHFDLALARKPDLPIESRRSAIAVIDPFAIAAFDTPEPDKLAVCAAPHGLALAPGGDVAYVACYGEDAIGIVDLADTYAPVVRVPVGLGAGPYGVALSPDGARLAIGARDGHDVRFMDVTTRVVGPPVPALGETYVPAWSADGASVFVPTRSMDGVARIDARTGAVVRQRLFEPRTCVAPIEAVVRGDRLLVVCEGDAETNGAIVTLDAATLASVARVPLGRFPGRPFVGTGP